MRYSLPEIIAVVKRLINSTKSSVQTGGFSYHSELHRRARVVLRASGEADMQIELGGIGDETMLEVMAGARPWFNR